MALTEGERTSGQEGPVNNAELGSEDSTHDGLNEEARKTEEALDKLKAMCNVLGISYNSKISEFGSKLERKRVEECLAFLTVTRDTNFEQLKGIATNIMKAWKSFDTPIRRVEDFAWILSIRDAKSSAEVMESGLLSTAHVRKAKNELLRLTKERERKLMGKYSALTNKLEKMLKQAHLTADDFEIDIKTEVTMQEYKYEKMNLKSTIRDVKIASGQRKELILRMEMVRAAVKSKKVPLEQIDGDVAKKMEDDAYEFVSYEGKGVDDVLQDFRVEAINAANERAQKAKEMMSRPKTRAGRTIRSVSTGDQEQGITTEDTIDVEVLEGQVLLFQDVRKLPDTCAEGQRKKLLLLYQNTAVGWCGKIDVTDSW